MSGETAAGSTGLAAVSLRIQTVRQSLGSFETGGCPASGGKGVRGRCTGMVKKLQVFGRLTRFPLLRFQKDMGMSFNVILFSVREPVPRRFVARVSRLRDTLTRG